MEYLNAIILWIHLFAAVLFVGGSFFMWLVVLPASRSISVEESKGSMIIAAIARKFGPIAWFSLLILVITGMYNATWYLPDIRLLFQTAQGLILFTKSILVAVLIITVYIHNVYYGKRIGKFAREGKADELAALRRRSRIVSALNLALMVLILFLAVLMQSY